MRLIDDDVTALRQARQSDGHVGHARFWERALSRRQFLRKAAVAGGGAVTAVEFDFEEASASLELSNFEIDDYHDVVNALVNDKVVATGHVDVELQWSGVLSRGVARVPNPDRRFNVEFIHDQATLEWSAREPGFGFESTSSKMGFAEIGPERNGVLFE